MTERKESGFRLRQYRMYLLLAALDLLTVGASFYLNHRLVTAFQVSVATDAGWAKKLGDVADITALVSLANAPGNDIFESGAVDACASQFESVHEAYSQMLAERRDSLSEVVEEADRLAIEKHLAAADGRMQEQAVEARAIFDLYREGDREGAASHMSAMDRASLYTTRAYADISTTMRGAQHRNLKAQGEIAKQLGALETAIAFLIVLMVLGICVYCWFVRRGKLEKNREILLYRNAIDEHAIVAVTDRSGRITFVNDKFVEISGYTRDEIIGQDHRLLNSGLHPKAFWLEMYQTVHAGKTWQGEVRNRAKDGSFYWVDTTITPEVDENGKVVRIIALRRDTTAEKRGEKEILEALKIAEVANKSKSEFLANMSHEIRTPMTAILGYADLLCEESLDAETHNSHVETIQRNGEHLLTIINDILDLSKIEAGKMTVEQMETPVLPMIDDVVKLMRVRADGKNIVLRVQYLTPVPTSITSDIVRLRQILVNLVGNAIKFTEAGSVTLSVSHLETGNGEEPELKVAVTDTGIGMTEAQASRMFVAFNQADTTTTRKFGGTGLGLVISQRLAEMLGGLITVESKSGEGSTFTLSVSAKRPTQSQTSDLNSQATAQQLDKAAVASKTFLAGRKILLAEDGPDNQRLISFVLRKAGACVEIAENGSLAVDAVANAESSGEPFDLVLMDMQMPVMDGLTATTTLREQGRKLPIVALTAHAMASDRERCIQSGCDDFATKPINRPVLLTLCRNLTKPYQPEPCRGNL